MTVDRKVSMTHAAERSSYIAQRGDGWLFVALTYLTINKYKQTRKKQDFNDE